MKKGSEKNLILKNYKLAASYSRDQRRGGTCILINKEIDFLKIDITQAIDYTFECCAIELPQYKVIIVCIYRTPTSNTEIFLRQLQSLLHMLSRKRNKRIILCGDWNIDLLQTNKNSTELKSLLSNNNMTSYINTPTRKKACLDLIVSNIKHNVKSEVHYLCLSDHETGQSLTFEVEANSNVCHRYTTMFECKRDMCEENIEKFLQCISSLTFSEVIAENDMEKAFTSFYDTLVLFYKLCFPIIKVKLSNKPVRNSWLTKGIKRCCIHKRQLYLKYRLTSNNKHIKQQYLKYSRILKKCIYQAQKNNNTKYICKSKNICKTTWDIVKQYTHDINSKTEIQNIRTDNNNFINDPEKISEEFNKFYISLTNKSIDREIDYKKVITDIPIHHNSIYLTPVNENDILKIIRNLKQTNSTGYDGINTKIIKKSAIPIVIPLTHIINLSLVQGKFPTELKRSVVKPLHKTGARSELGNYRPITLIPILSKIFEKVMYDKVYNFLSVERLLKEEQFGFRRNSSTTLACFNLIKELTQNLNNKLHTIAIFLDMSKAFDYVCHKLLLCKLERYGIRGNALSWLESYLNNRDQCVEITKTSQNMKKIYSSSYSFNRCGVPQGSVLGPLMFLVYINDLPNVIDQKCILFADDTTLIIKSKSLSDLERIANCNLEKVVQWLENNNLKINVSKTKFIKFQTSHCVNINNKLDINYKNNAIDNVQSTKFLGIVIDNFCNWKAHIDSLVNKLDRFVYALNRIRQVASQEAAVMAYNGYVSSTLRYGLILWGNSVDAQRAFVLQKKCIRSICGAHYLDSCKPLFKKLNILPLPCLYIFEIGNFVHKYDGLFKKNKDYQHRGRRGERLCIPPQRLALCSRNSYCMAVRIYNKIPDNFKKLTFVEFRSKLQNFLMNKLYYTVNEFLNDKLTIVN